MRKLLLSLTVLTLFLSAVALKAQNTAAMTGVVRDVTGAVVPGTTVILSNAHIGVSYTTTTDSQGSYRFANVPPDPGYSATFTHGGFAAVAVRSISLQVGITRTQNATLVAGAHAEVEVSAAPSEVTLNTTDASIGNNLDPATLNELPIQDRTAGITNLFYLQAGVDSSTGAVTGAREDQSETTLDGMDVNDIAAGQGPDGFVIVGHAAVDSVQEFRGVVAGLVPSVGTGSGGQFQLVTRNGTNQFHGNINEYHRDTTTEANTYFNNLVGLPRTPLIRNQFGGNIGGPVIIPHFYNGKDKLFFFFNFADSRIIQSASEERTVPLDSYRNGTLNYILASGDDGSACDSARLNTDAPCIGSIPNMAATGTSVQSLDPQNIGFSQPLLSFLDAQYPHANDLTRGDGINTGGFRFTTPTPDLETNYVGRVDYNLTPHQRIFGRFTIERENETYFAIQFPGEPNPTNPFIDDSYSYVLSHIWQISDTKVNQFYYGDTIQKDDFPGLYNPTGTEEIIFGPSSAPSFSDPYPDQSTQKRRVPIPEVRDDFNWQKGNHNFAFGGTFKFVKTDSQLINDFNFVTIGLGGETTSLNAKLRPSDIGTGATATNEYDSLFTSALGRIGEVDSNYNYTSSGDAIPQGSGEIRRYRFYQTELYFADTWKVTPHLTLSYGLRYQLYSVPYEANGEESVPYLTNSDGSTSTATFENYIGARVKQSSAGISGPSSLPFLTYKLGGKANHGAPLYQPSYKDFAPRFAFAYNPSFLPKTVINGSAGIVYDRTVINAVNFIQDQSSYLFQNTASNPFGQTDPVASLATDPRVSAGATAATLGYTGPVPAPAITTPYIPYVDDGYPYGLDYNEFSYMVDPHLKDPYSIALNMGIQQEFPGHLIMKLSYAGRLGRRLIAQADASQLVDFLDTSSGQMMGTAFANLVTEMRSGKDYTDVTPQPWFENQINEVAPGIGEELGLPNNTAILAAYVPDLVARGDFGDSIQFLASNGLLDNNVGMAAQFAGNTYITNKGFSSYNGLLLTVSKNLSQGLQFDFNYTWSHSIDNTSQVANSISSGTGYGFICDVLRPRECRANSDFDVRQEISSDFLYQLPFGHGKAFAGSSPQWVDEIIGGWALSGIPGYRTGVPVDVITDAFVAGYANNAPAIFIGNRGDLRENVHRTSTGAVFGFNSSAAADFVGPIGFQIGQRNYFSGPGAFTMDAGLAKTFPVFEQLRLVFRADAFNVFNHPNFSTPSVDLTSASTFGQITSTVVGSSTTVGSSARVAQFSLRLEF